jgi:hypothetical protein
MFWLFLVLLSVANLPDVLVVLSVANLPDVLVVS